MSTVSNSPEDIEAQQRRRGIVIMLLSVTAFSVNTLLLRYLSGEERQISPEVPLLFRAAVGIVIVLVFFRGRRPTRIRPVFREPLLIARGVTGLLGTAAYYFTVPTLGAGMATVICNTYVIFASLIAVLALGEKLTPGRLAWLALSFVGIVLLLGMTGRIDEFRLGVFEGIALVGAILAASSVVLVRRLVVDHSIGTIYLAQCVWIVLPVISLAVPQLTGLSGFEILLLVLAATAAGWGQLAMNEGYRVLPVSTGASIQMFWPVATTLGGIFLFSERLEVLQLVGACLIIVSVWRVSASPMPKSSPTRE